MPDLGLVRTPPGVRIVALREPVTRNVQLAVRAAGASRPAYEAVRDALVAAAAELSPITTAA